VSVRHSTRQLAKYIEYMLGRQPDEFGLVPDEQGYIKLKELLKAIWEEHGWRYVKRSHIDDIIYTLSDPPIEMQDERIRAINRTHLPKPVQIDHPPKLLYTSVRRKAYPHVLQQGIYPMGGSQVIMCASRSMAERMGKRIDPSPVVLTVQVEKSINQNVVFYQMGRFLFLAKQVPPGCFTGPALPREKPQQKQKPLVTERAVPRLAGGFELNLENIKTKPYGKGKKKEIGWKRDRKRRQKEKKKGW